MARKLNVNIQNGEIYLVEKNDLEGLIEAFSKTKKYLTVNEAAEYLNIASSTVYELIRERQIPHSKIKTKILIDVKDIDNFFRKNKVKDIEDALSRVKVKI
jgi:excisionase family DNA binding protein